MSKRRYPDNPVLLVDDEKNWINALSFSLKSSAGFNNLIACTDGREVMKILGEIEISVVVLDLNMPYITGEELLCQIVQDYPQIPIIILSGQNQLETAVSCVKKGAFDYFVKTVGIESIKVGIERALRFSSLQLENSLLRQNMLQQKENDLSAFRDIISANTTILSLFKYIQAISASREPVLITGESGVGKELFAEAVHHTSCQMGPWVTVNTAGLDDSLFTDALFGHMKGAFSGADQHRAGMVEQAEDGTLFLDEIGDLSLVSQIKLLRFLQSGEYYPVGSDSPRRSNARLIFATNQNLQVKQMTGQFRKDLYYRLKSHLIEIPPLRERKDDLPLLLDYFLDETSSSLNKKKPTPPPELHALLATYDFPGNVRELRAMVHNAVSMHSSHKLSMKSFRQSIGQTTASSNILNSQPDENEALLLFGNKLPTLKAAADQLVKEAMQRAGNNQTIAAGLLGIAQSSLNRRLKNLKKS